MIIATGLAAAVAMAQRSPEEATAEITLATEMAEAGQRWLSALTAAQRAKATFPFAAEERLRWHYVPMARKGIALKDLDDAQRALAFGLLTTALSRRGMLKTTGIIALEEVLRRRSQSSFVRDPGAYYLTVFGEPSQNATWGWRFEGHHLSLSITLVDGVRPVEAPAFWGASPAHVTAGAAGGLLADSRVLGREEDLGFQLLGSLDDAQKKVAVIKSAAPDDILTGPGAALAPLPGLAASRMTPAQRQLLDALIAEVTGYLPHEIAIRERARIAAHPPSELIFTWAGATVPRQGHYFRLSGPSFLYELDNTQEGANHVHTVWHARQPSGGDFGVDLLRQHYERAHARPLDSAENKQLRAAWGKPIEPFRIAGNLYYVGASNIASYLIATSRGLILIDTGTLEMAPRVRAGIVKLGFRIEDVKVLLTSHAHWDHVEGLAEMKRLTGAQVMALAEEVPALSSGKDLSALGDLGWEPVAVDRVLKDGDDVVLGEVTLRARKTAGHTQGCTTWTTTVADGGRSYSVAFVGIPIANASVALLDNKRHPTIASDLAHALSVLKSLKPDIYLMGHPEELFAGKLDRLRQGASPNPLLDRGGYRKLLEEAEDNYQSRLRNERSARK